MNLTKHMEFFDPFKQKRPIHIIGCGALGSHVAVLLARLGTPAITLWDMDTVSPHNITNQVYLHKHIKQLKVNALKEILQEINPDIKVTVKAQPYKETFNLSGYIFLMVDSIELRQKFVKAWINNPTIDGVFDARMRLTDGQCYAANWRNPDDKQALLNSMDFTSEEAKEATPVSACGTALSVTPTVWNIASATVANYMNLVEKKELGTVILLDAFEHTINKF